MQPMAGTQPARDEAGDIDDWTATRPTSQDTACPDRDQGPQTARPRASARPGLSTALTTDCWFDLAGDMRLRRPRGTSTESGPHLFRRAGRVAAPTVHTDHLAQDRGRSRRPGRRPRHRARRRAMRRGGGPSVPAGASRSGGQARHAGGEVDRTSVETANTTSETAHNEHHEHDNDTLDDIPNRVTAPALPHRHDLHHLPARPTPDCLPRPTPPLLIPMLDNLLLAAAPPPALPLPAWAAPRFIWQVEEGGSSAKRWTPLPRKPRRDAKSGPEAGRRPGDLLRPPARDHQPQTTTPTRGHLRSPAAWPLRPWDLGRPKLGAITSLSRARGSSCA